MPDERERQMLDVAGEVADFAYKQGVGEATAVDDLIVEYRRLRDALRDIACIGVGTVSAKADAHEMQGIAERALKGKYAQ